MWSFVFPYIFNPDKADLVSLQATYFVNPTDFIRRAVKVSSYSVA